MSENPNGIGIRRRITVVILIFVCCHILVAFTFLFVPKSKIPEALQSYKALTYIGPFFSSRNLVSSYHIVATVSHPNGTDENRDLTEEFQSGYISEPWKYHLLAKKVYIRHVTAALGTNLISGRGVESDSVQRQIHQVADFLNQELNFRKDDSVRCGFLWKKYSRSERTHQTDTFFYLPIPIHHGW